MLRMADTKDGDDNDDDVLAVSDEAAVVEKQPCTDERCQQYDW